MVFRSDGNCQKQDGNVYWCHCVTATYFLLLPYSFYHVHDMCHVHANITCSSRVMANVTYKGLYWKPKHSPFVPSKIVQNQVTTDERIISLKIGK